MKNRTLQLELTLAKGETLESQNLWNRFLVFLMRLFADVTIKESDNIDRQSDISAGKRDA